MLFRSVARLGLHPPFITANGQTLGEIWDLIAEYGYLVDFDGESVDKAWFCSEDELFDVNLMPA